MNTIHTFTLAGRYGTEAYPLEIGLAEAKVFTVDAVAPHTAKEIAIRVWSALLAIDQPLEVLPTRVTIGGKAPKHRISGAALDLPIAYAIILAGGADWLPTDLMVMGELGLDGSVRPVRGVLQATELAKYLGLRGVLVPHANAQEALCVDGVEVYGLRHLRDLGECLTRPESREFSRAKKPHHPDMSEVRGQADALGVIETAAVAHAGGRRSYLTLAGAPGTGKTMLARRIPGILPALTRDQKLEVTRVYSAIGLASGLIEDRPFRAPHHTISAAALVGKPAYNAIGQFGEASGGRPGEVHLAAHGVIMLDELPEFSRQAIESLRYALDAMGAERPMIVAAASPCPCGWADTGVRECCCTKESRQRYTARVDSYLAILGPFTRCPIASVSLADLRSETPGPSSASIRARVALAIGGR